MGIGFRIFLIKDDDSLERVSLSRYQRLLRHDPTECFPEQAGKRIRYVLVMLEINQRKPVAIHRIQCSFLRFDSEGRLDIKAREREARMAVELFPPLPDQDQPVQLIDARHRFARKRYANEYLWEPTPEIESAIKEAIFGKQMC
jgi:hypothetical protein